MKWLSMFGIACMLIGCTTSTQLQPASEIQFARYTAVDFNKDWRFTRGEQSTDATRMDFDDNNWQAVRLPHDWAIAGPFNLKDHGYSGKLPWKGIGWYRKEFMLDQANNGKRVYLDFDGVMAFPQVYINGHLAGQWDYGYMSFRIDATPYIKFDQKNVIAVRVDTHNQGTRWYPGAGIYRKVLMTICDPVHIAHWGTVVTTPNVSDTSATVRVSSTIENHLNTESDIIVNIALLDPLGRIIAKKEQKSNVPAGEDVELEQIFEVNNPKRWDITSPNLYTAEVIVQTEEKIVDADRINFGIRSFKFTANDGFHLNGRRIQLYGVNLHHDQGPLGAAFHPRAMERQLEIMMEMGVNSIRTSHNPPAPELLDMCDRMGLVVWDECFDKWDDKAGRINGQPPLEQYGEKQIRNFVMRDRNHPSIVVWSIGNEISNQPNDAEGKSAERVKFMREFFLKYDDTRPVTLACHIPYTATVPILDDLDLTGWNYARRYANYRERYPDKPIIYSESASALSTRGFYEFPQPKYAADYSKEYQVSSYDLNAAPWSDIADAEFLLMEKDSFVAGEFVWTGFDYLGEPTPFDQQARSSYFGIVDLCGIPKDRYYLYRSYWLPDTLTVHILPHWNWPQRIGENVPVFVYTNGDSAELFLNGKSLGRKTKGQIPQGSPNLAKNKPITAASTQADETSSAVNAVDDDRNTRWCAASGSKDQWLQVDMEKVQTIRYIGIKFEKASKNYGYKIEASKNASEWYTLATKAASDRPRWGSPREIYHEVEGDGRYVRLVFTDLKDHVWASVCEFGVYSQKVESSYYDPTYKYRLRWNDVIYEPGEIRAVVYKGEQKIGEKVVRTAGKPAQIRLTPDRKKLSADGQDLCYVLVEAVDATGTLCPLADNMISFDIKGPAEIAGVGNGNPMSFEPFQADYRKLFYGKAMLILRTKEGKTGTIRITASSEGLHDTYTSIRSMK